MAKVTKFSEYTVKLSEAEFRALLKLSTAMLKTRVEFRGNKEDAWDVIADLIGGEHANQIKYMFSEAE